MPLPDCFAKIAHMYGAFFMMPAQKPLDKGIPDRLLGKATDRLVCRLPTTRYPDFGGIAEAGLEMRKVVKIRVPFGVP